VSIANGNDFAHTPLMLEQIKAARDFIRDEGHVIRQAPVTFIVGWLFVGAIIFAILEWHFNAELDTQKDTIENQQTRIAALQDELKGASPQLAALQARRYRQREELLKLYVKIGALISDQMKLQTAPKGKDLQDVYDKITSWERETSSWLRVNLGEAAEARFLDTVSMPSYTWTGGDYKYTITMNAVINERKNLSILIENAAYDK
jgi:hypothetical protein